MMRPRVLLLLFLCLLAVAGLSISAAGFSGVRDDAVFDGPPAPMASRLQANVPGAEPLRVLTVEERVGVARRRELVRVPLFFHDGECADPQALAVYASEDTEHKTPLPYQADDIRRDAAGKVSRMHLYFLIDLEPWQRKQFHLVAGTNSARDLQPVPVQTQGGQVTLAGEDMQVTFRAEGAQAGAICGLSSALGTLKIADILAPSMTLVRQDKDCKPLRSTPLSYADPQTLEIRELRWSSGPLFAKLVLRIGPKGVPDNAEFTYRIPRHGTAFIQTERLFPSEPNSADVVGAEEHVLLTGRLALGATPAAQRVVKVPAGLRKLTRAEHGAENDALVDTTAGVSLFPVPYVQTGVRGITAEANGLVSVRGTQYFRRTPDANSGTLRAFWGEVRYVVSNATTEEALWETGRAYFQPLTAIVDEPGLTKEMLSVDLQGLAGQFSDIRVWPQQAAQFATLRRYPELVGAINKASSGDLSSASLVKAAQATREKLLRGRPEPLRENEKGAPASGPLDAYGLTYSMSAIAPIAAFVVPSPRLDQVCLAYSHGSRQFNGKVDKFGFPYIDCFYTAYNMQMGSYLMGIYVSKKYPDLPATPDLLQFYRDAARTPASLDLFGHGQRSYNGLALGWGTTDLLYESVCDYWLRTTELTANEDLWLHPAAYGRYADCVDVNADLCHRGLNDTGGRVTSWWRANLFRAQGHDHRWEAWAVAPFMPMLRNAGDDGAVGMTEASYYARHLLGKKPNWSDITYIALFDLNMRYGLPQYQPEPAPPLPADVRSEQQDGKTVVRWQAVPGDILGYRIYRAEKMGGPWTLLNSPYTATPAAPVTETSFTDPDGKPGQLYWVTALDNKRRESRWFPDEPLPGKGVKAVEAKAAEEKK